MKTSRLWIYRMVKSLMPENRFYGIKVALLRWCGACVGSHVRINSSADFRGCGDLRIGDDVWIGPNNFISAVGGTAIEIGSCCDLGPAVMILTGSHKIDPEGEHIAGQGFSQSVTIGAGTWLGARCTILPGVNLPRKTLVAAGAVVTKTPLVEMGLVAGVPATVRKVLK